VSLLLLVLIELEFMIDGHSLQVLPGWMTATSTLIVRPSLTHQSEELYSSNRIDGTLASCYSFTSGYDWPSLSLFFDHHFKPSQLSLEHLLSLVDQLDRRHAQLKHPLPLISG
jgi:hypothetical protein